MLLFHLHFDVPDVPGAEEKYVEAGFSVIARFGYVGQSTRDLGRRCPGRSYRGARCAFAWSSLSEAQSTSC